MEEKELTAQYFLSSLSHEIRTPLNGVVGYTQLMLQTKLDSTQKMYLTSMNQCCLQLMQLINDILDFSKLATGKMHINHECFDIREAIDEVNSALGYRIKEKKQKCRYILSKDLPRYIITDKTKLVQIMINLVSNANKFTSIGGKINVTIMPGRDNMIEVSVHDNGIGISDKHKPLLFDAFYQVKESVTKSGSGLGLAICKKLSELLGGGIHFDSEDGKGTTFTFNIKYEPYEMFQEKVEQNSKSLKGKYVLIVDDNVDNRVILGELLFECRLRPIICSSAKEAIRMITRKRYPFAAALVDICMPGMSGTEMAKNVKQIEPDLPMIALSSLDEAIDETNFEYVMRKPVDKVRMLDYLTKVINRSCIDDCMLEDTDEVEEEKMISRKDARILIAEDISYNLNMLIKMLESLGYHNIDTSTDGEETIVKLEQQYNKGNPYDILLLDLKMPKVDGFAVAEHMKARGYVYPKTAVLSASVLETDRERCKTFGIKYFILKPINMTHLKVVLKHLSSETEANIMFTK